MWHKKMIKIVFLMQVEHYLISHIDLWSLSRVKFMQSVCLDRLMFKILFKIIIIIFFVMYMRYKVGWKYKKSGLEKVFMM